MSQINNTGACTLETCPLSSATVGYDPTLVRNALYLAMLGIILVIQALQLSSTKQGVTLAR